MRSKIWAGKTTSSLTSTKRPLFGKKQRIFFFFLNIIFVLKVLKQNSGWVHKIIKANRVNASSFPHIDTDTDTDTDRMYV